MSATLLDPASAYTLSLNGQWELFSHGSHETIPATVPGCVHTAHLAAERIEDPFFRENELEAQWVAYEDWVYRRMFTVSPEMLRSPKILLCCEGLDTIASISLNGELLADTNNMFRRWEFDVKPLLKEGENEIAILFRSAPRYIEERQRINPMIYPTAPHQIGAFSQIRKAAFGFGWDWGPCLPTIGIWKPIYLQFVRAGRLTDVSIQQKHSPHGEVALTVTLEVDSPLEEEGALKAEAVVRFQGNEIDRAVCTLDGSRGRLELTIRAPRLWWPNGMGEQPLYEVDVQLLDAKSRFVDGWSRRIGLRQFRLNTDADRWGNAFAFEVNGVPFFAKGTNWIPADALLSRITEERYRSLLSAAAEAHMNMVRVWGGGIYEPDEFYDLCDELGLCVWQDFMFACAPYPLEDPAFVENAEIEMAQQIKRLRHHASLALWCGNNEIEYCGFVALKGDATHIPLGTYRAFFETKINHLLSLYSPEHASWPGSPYKEPGDVYDPDVASYSPERGDVHIWTVGNGARSFEAYREYQNRFISEFGFQSFPEPTSVERFTNPEDRNIESAVIRHHQRGGAGNALVLNALQDWFREPRSFESLLWCSQILQGIGIQLACEHWRRGMPRTMGTLIWQLNDAWPVTSWSGIDYYGQWKAMHYMARRFYAPVLVSGLEDPESGGAEIHLTNDLLNPVSGYLQWKLTNLKGEVIVQEESEGTAPAQSNLLAAKLTFREELEKHGRKNLLLWLDFRDEKGESLSKNLVLFTRPKEIDLLDPELDYRVTTLDDSSFAVEVHSKKPALWVWLEIPGTSLHASDNFFHLDRDHPVQVILRPSQRMTVDEVSRLLRVRSLFDSYL